MSAATQKRGVFARRRRGPSPGGPGGAGPAVARVAQDALVGEADGERGVALAMRLGGERALPVDRGMVLLSPGRLCRHLLVCGATGSGKTETVLRLAWTIAKSFDAPCSTWTARAIGRPRAASAG